MASLLRFRAAVALAGRPDLVVEEVESAGPGDGEVLVQVTASGICASDRHVMAEGMNFGPGIGVVGPPMVLGHELAGTVLEVGSGIQRLKVGDRVVGAATPACGQCGACIEGFANMCETFVDVVRQTRYRTLDWTATAMCGLGSFAELSVVRESQVVKVDTDLPEAELALIGCGIVTGAGAVFNRAHLRPGASVAIVGCGGVGLAALQAAHIAGAVRIFAVDPAERKRTLAASLGATDLVDPTTSPGSSQVVDLTAGRGVDLAIEAFGSAATTTEALAMTGRGGLCIQLGSLRPGERLELPLGGGERMFVSSAYGSGDVRRDIPRLVALAQSGRLNLKSLVSEIVPLSASAVTTAVTAPNPDSIRTVIDPRQS